MSRRREGTNDLVARIENALIQKELMALSDEVLDALARVLLARPEDENRVSLFRERRRKALTEAKRWRKS